MTLLYLDASALVKLVREERESDALERYLDGADALTSEVAVVELMRAARRAAAIDPRLDADALTRTSAELLEAIALLPIEREVLLRAAGLQEPFLRALDAVHIASAVAAGGIDAFVTYDERQSAAARLAGLRTVSPQPIA